MQGSNIGRVIRWDEVKHGMLVRSDPGTGLVWHYVKLGEHGCTVGCHGTHPDSRASWGYMVGSELPKWSGWSLADALVTVVAEGMTGAETGARLRALSEAYDARLEVEIAAFEARQNDLSLKLMGL